MKKLVMAALAATIALTSVAAVAPAEAQVRGFHGPVYGRGFDNRGFERRNFALGFLGGALLGGVVAGSLYHAYDRDYYVAPYGPGYNPGCDSFYVRDAYGNYVLDAYGNYLVTQRCW